MRLFHFLIIFFLLQAMPASAQTAKIDYPIVTLQVLDKSTARTSTFDAKVGTTMEYGSLFIKVQSCRKSNPLEKPESASFLQIWEVPINAKKSEWIFSGWMFASSPSLSAMDHPVYDVWVLDCALTKKSKNKSRKIEEVKKDADQGDLDAPDEEEVSAEPKASDKKDNKSEDNEREDKKDREDDEREVNEDSEDSEATE